MKRSKLILSLAVAGLSLGFLVGCGGGSSGGGSDDIPANDITPTAQLSSQNVNKFAQSVSDEIGCTYTQIQSAPILRSAESSFLPIKTIISDVSVMLNDKGINVNNLRVNIRESETIPGACGGNMVVYSSSDGKSGSYTFNNYCSTTSDNTNIITNGALALSSSKSGSGMILDFSTTKSINIKSTNPNTGKKIDTTFDVKNGSFYSSDSNLGVDFDNPSGTTKLTVSSISVKDNVTKKYYSFQNVKVNMSSSSTTFSASYTDPDLGLVTLSSNDSDIGAKSGDVVITGAAGEKALISTTSTEGILNVTTDGELIGKMDCSTVDI